MYHHQCPRTALFFIFREDSFRRSDGLQDDFRDIQARTIAALRDVLDRGCAGSNDVDLRLKPHSGHPNRLTNAVLTVDDEFLRDNMENFSIRGDGERLRRVDDSRNVVSGDFFVFYGDDTVAVQALDVGPGNAHVHGGGLAPGHELGFADRLGDALHGALY